MSEGSNWFSDRTWSLSGNKEEEFAEKAGKNDDDPAAATSAIVVFPKSTLEVSQLLSDVAHRDRAIAVVCGGHSSSNVATWPAFLAGGGSAGSGTEEDERQKTLILDMKNMSSITVNDETGEVTVGGGVLFRELAEACAKAKCALPIGTGPTVGVTGYVLNGGISGYFGRRLGMLGQRVTRLEVVLANGDVRTLSSPSSSAGSIGGEGGDEDLFRACLGAGSAMGVVTSLTIRMEDESSFRSGGSLVVACSAKSTAKAFLKKALSFMKDSVMLPSPPSTSMEIVTTSDFTVICTLMFYDSFDGDPEAFVAPLRQAATECGAPIVADAVTSHKSWFDAASSLWGVIDGMKGNPLVRMDHSIGTEGIPGDEVLDFLLDRWLGSFLEKAPLTIVEIRTLGGAASEGANGDPPLPTGNVKCSFFADMIVSYDSSTVAAGDKSSILAEVHGVIADAKEMRGRGLMVDFSGTHGQSDDPTALLPDGDEVFGGRENRDLVRAIKKKHDPSNRFRYHPFAHYMD
ncbi:hypothetical protein ACHAW5_008326 [Stephanodiscus triporus]|uniref:FAD-binding PCMH-type domain-containing protein n=1 Tax=Stephanodiscus triporus TaxID=2934178 RepID=A0ABD3PC26_9STRA